MYDGQEAVTHRMDFSSRMGEVDPAIVTMLQGMLECENVLVGMFKQLRDRITGSQPEPVTLRLLARRTSDGRLENIPTENDYKFAGLVVDNDFTNHRDVVAEHKKTGLQHISDLHPSYMSLQYPLLFPYGEDGYRTNIKHRNAENSEFKKNNKVSMREYYVFRAQYRKGEGHTIILGGRLFLQFIVDAWCSVEHGRLIWVRRHQSLIRSELYNNIVDSMRRGDVDATDLGKRVVLPSSFTGGYRYMQQNFQDSLALCKEFGHPDLFITFTCNPKWAEIQHAVHASGSHDASVRPDIVARVFKMKLDTMINDLTKKHVLGHLVGVFTCCISADIMDADEYKNYLGGIVAQIHEYYTDASFMAFNFLQGSRQTHLANILVGYDVTVMDYTRQYETSPLLTMEMLHHFLRSDTNQ
ncbi:uncharacterized protein LOC141712757 isoform X8 [Apium graveolens]|uniref:uncharacterized protein LOC141712757 isoform X8 n=1 Tax=Apium graveolens TaxID=4045 RepID=UPI003D7B3E7A